MTKKAWIIFVVVVLGIFTTIYFITKTGSIDVSNVDTDAVLSKIESSEGTVTQPEDHVYGKKDATIVLVEYGDYQCPGCGGAYTPINSIKQRYKDNIAFVFRNLPLTNIHPNALAAATAAEAAGKQGKYWEMHDLLYTTQNNWSNVSINERNTLFEQYAEQVGLNLTQYRNDLESSDIAYKIRFDRALASKIGATGTPTVLLNGQKLTDEEINSLAGGDESGLAAKIDALIKEQGGTPPASPQDAAAATEAPAEATAPTEEPQ